jgi:predicted transcriptional regulator YheO
MDDLPEDIRKEIETNSDGELIMEIVRRLQGEGIKVTRDVVAAIKMTLECSEGTVE